MKITAKKALVACTAAVLAASAWANEDLKPIDEAPQRSNVSYNKSYG